MKKMTIIVAVALCATSAFASKARLKALSASPHLQDTRNVFVKPDQALVHGEFVSMETSANVALDTATAGTGNDTAPNAEGGFVRKMNDTMAMGAWLGNKSNLATAGLSDAGSTVTLQNPLNLYFASKAGEMNWGAGLYYASHDDKANKDKASAMGLALSASSTAGWDAQFGMGLTGEATDNDTTKYEQKSPMYISGGYWMDTMYLYGKYAMNGGKSKAVNGGAALGETDSSTTQVGIVNSHKKDGADFFYGVSYLMTQEKVKNGTKTEGTCLPVVIGIEADAASWLVLRGSITQNVLLGTNKITPNGAAASEQTMLDNTVVAAGLGLKLGKFMVDGTLAATTPQVAPATSTSGKFGSDAGFLSEVALTYAF